MRPINLMLPWSAGPRSFSYRYMWKSPNSPAPKRLNPLHVIIRVLVLAWGLFQRKIVLYQTSFRVTMDLVHDNMMTLSYNRPACRNNGNCILIIKVISLHLTFYFYFEPIPMGKWGIYTQKALSAISMGAAQGKICSHGAALKCPTRYSIAMGRQDSYQFHSWPLTFWGEEKCYEPMAWSTCYKLYTLQIHEIGAYHLNQYSHLFHVFHCI